MAEDVAVTAAARLDGFSETDQRGITKRKKREKSKKANDRRTRYHPSSRACGESNSENEISLDWAHTTSRAVTYTLPHDNSTVSLRRRGQSLDGRTVPPRTRATNSNCKWQTRMEATSKQHLLHPPAKPNAGSASNTRTTMDSQVPTTTTSISTTTISVAACDMQTNTSSTTSNHIHTITDPSTSTTTTRVPTTNIVSTTTNITSITVSLLHP